MEFGVLGPIRVTGPEGDLAVTGVLRQTLLGILLAHADRSAPVDLLVDALWPDRPDRAAHRLHVQVSKLRRALGDPALVEFDQTGYRLRVRPGEFDAARFTAMLDEARQVADRDPDRCAELVRTALALWRGTPYGGLDVPVLADAAARLTERRLAAVELLFDAELSRGRHAEVVPELTALVREHPLRERLSELLMTALYRNGRQAEALAVYRSARDLLVAELGLEPGVELRALEQRILAGEPLVTAAAPDRAPAQLPHDVRGFVGRDAELDELDELLACGDSVCVLAGTAGAGKTALAVHWAHRVHERFPDGQLYIDLRGYDPEPPVSPSDALAGFLRALGQDSATVPTDLSERAALFRTLVRGRRLLVVLDNARSPEQVRPLLPGAASAFVVVTSRDTLAGLAVRDGARRIDVGRLPAGEARRLLARLAGDRVGALGAADVLAELCARLPLALRIAAELINSRRRTGVAELVAELAGERDSLDLLDTTGDPHTSVRAVFSWSYRHLPPSDARLFRFCGLHPGHDLDVAALAALGDADPRAVRRALDVLVAGHLVDADEDGRLRLHDLLRAYAVELTLGADPEPDREAALERLRDHYLHTSALAMDQMAPHESAQRPKVSAPAGAALTLSALSGHDEALRWLDTERANLVAVATHGPPGYLIRMSAMLWRYLDLGGYYDEAMVLHERALDAARQHGDAAELGDVHRFLGVTEYRRCRFDEAEAHFEQALHLFSDVGDRRRQAALFNNLGNLTCRRGDYVTAVGHFEQAVTLHRELGDLALSAAALGNLGAVHRELGDDAQARHYLEAALAAAEDAGDRPTAAGALRELVRVCRDTGHHADALSYLDRAVPLARAAGVRLVEAELLGLRGVVHCLLGDHELAVRHHEEALRLVRVIGDRPILSDLLNGFAETRFAAGEWAKAVRGHREALAVATDSGTRDEQARAHAGLGNAHDRLGDRETARTHWQLAMAGYRELGLPQADELRDRLDR